MRRIVTLISLVGIISPPLAWADWKYAHWGAKPEQLALASGGAVKVLPLTKRKKLAEPWNSLTAATGSYIDGKLHLDLSFGFDSKSGGLKCIVFDAASGSPAQQIKQLFITMNGRPQTTANHKDMGMETFSWSTKSDQTGLTLMADGSAFATRCVPGTNPPYE